MRSTIYHSKAHYCQYSKAFFMVMMVLQKQLVAEGATGDCDETGILLTPSIQTCLQMVHTGCALSDHVATVSLIMDIVSI